MTVVHLVAGAGGMYCGSCLQGNTLAAALVKAGEDVAVVPVYTPLHTDEPSQAAGRPVFGGINVYLQERWALFRHTPWFVDRLFDRPTLLRWLGSRGSSLRAKELGGLTVSMLRGEEGRQRKELDKLIHLLRQDVKPRIVHLANALLIGMARRIRDDLGVPVVCSLTGEDAFLEKLPEPYYSQARAELRRRAGDVTAWIALSRYYAAFMAEYLPADRARIHVVRPGVNLEGHGESSRGARFHRAGHVENVPHGEEPLPGDRGLAPSPQPTSIAAPTSSATVPVPLEPAAGKGTGTESADVARESTQRAGSEPVPAGRDTTTLGCLGRVCPDKGLHLLAEAMAKLSREEGLPPMKLRLAGYLDPADRAYLEEVRRRATEDGESSRFEYLGQLERDEKIAFLQSLDVLCAPSVFPESKGVPLVEAWANAVPVVAADHGATGELVADTGGGLVHRPGDAQSLAEALRQLAADPSRAAELGRRGLASVEERYRASHMAEEVMAVYRQLPCRTS